MKLNLEDWTSLASLGLSVMFVALLISFYNFLIGPEGRGPNVVVDPGNLFLQLIFISAAPCVVLAGFAFGMARTFGTRIGGTFLIAAGIIMIAGMVVGATMVPRIPSQYIEAGLSLAPYVFMAAGAGITVIGGHLLAATKRRPLRSDLDDLR